MKPRIFESYPAWMVLVGAGAALAGYLLGAYILSGFGAWALVLYLGYCVFVEVNVLRGSCVNCCYYGKACALGRGALCALFFKRGDPGRFNQRRMTFRDLVPDLLVPVIPLAGGVILLLRRFSWPPLLAMAAIILLATVGNYLVRGYLACPHCAQRELGCPAERYFGKRRDAKAYAGLRKEV